MATPEPSDPIGIMGKHAWKVQACAHEECGVWSEPLYFDSTPTLLAGGSRRFMDKGDGTVIDTRTHLKWIKNQDISEPNPIMTYQEALAYCQGLGQTKIGTFSYDWRLPTMEESVSVACCDAPVLETFPMDAISLHHTNGTVPPSHYEYERNWCEYWTVTKTYVPVEIDPGIWRYRSGRYTVYYCVPEYPPMVYLDRHLETDVFGVWCVSGPAPDLEEEEW